MVSSLAIMIWTGLMISVASQGVQLIHFAPQHLVCCDAIDLMEEVLLEHLLQVFPPKIGRFGAEIVFIVSGHAVCPPRAESPQKAFCRGERADLDPMANLN